jgi:hypothetical protein
MKEKKLLKIRSLPKVLRAQAMRSTTNTRTAWRSRCVYLAARTLGVFCRRGQNDSAVLSRRASRLFSGRALRHYFFGVGRERIHSPFEPGRRPTMSLCAGEREWWPPGSLTGFRALPTMSCEMLVIKRFVLWGPLRGNHVSR